MNQLLLIIDRPEMILFQPLTDCGTNLVRDAGRIYFNQLVQLLTKNVMQTHLESLLRVPIFVFAFALIHADIMHSNGNHLYPIVKTE